MVAEYTRVRTIHQCSQGTKTNFMAQHPVCPGEAASLGGELGLVVFPCWPSVQGPGADIPAPAKLLDSALQLCFAVPTGAQFLCHGSRDSPGGPVVKNLSSSAGIMGLILCREAQPLSI